MKPIKYPESIFCSQCSENVQMTDCRILDRKVKGKTLVEFDYVCISCGHRASASRDWEYLQFSEREFCRINGPGDFGAGAKGQGVVIDRPIPVPPKGSSSGKYA